MKKDIDKKILYQLLSGKKGKQYQGKQVIICAGDVFVVPGNRPAVDALMRKLAKNYPDITPTVTFVPKQATYILLV